VVAFQADALRLATGRAHHSATLLPSGLVLIWGGVDANGALISGGELLDPLAGTATPIIDIFAAFVADSTPPALAVSIPVDGAMDVPVNTQIALRLTEPVRGTTVTRDSVRLVGPTGSVAAATIAALLAGRADDDTLGLVVDDRRWTWREVIEESDRWAAALATLRRPGLPFHVRVLMGNEPEYLFALLGAARVGCVVVGINDTRRGDELARDIRHTDCTAVLCDASRAPLLGSTTSIVS